MFEATRDVSGISRRRLSISVAIFPVSDVDVLLSCMLYDGGKVNRWESDRGNFTGTYHQQVFLIYLSYIPYEEWRYSRIYVMRM